MQASSSVSQVANTPYVEWRIYYNEWHLSLLSAVSFIFCNSRQDAVCRRKTKIIIIWSGLEFPETPRITVDGGHALMNHSLNANCRSPMHFFFELIVFSQPAGVNVICFRSWITIFFILREYLKLEQWFIETFSDSDSSENQTYLRIRERRAHWIKQYGTEAIWKCSEWEVWNWEKSILWAVPFCVSLGGGLSKTLLPFGKPLDIKMKEWERIV